MWSVEMQFILLQSSARAASLVNSEYKSFSFKL